MRNSLRNTIVGAASFCAACASAAKAPLETPKRAEADQGSERSPEAQTEVGAAAHVHAQAPSWTLASLGHDAELLGNLGDVKRSVTSAVPEAQAFFDQGLALTYGFNHDEAARSFAHAGALDASCALCFWGAAYTLGPNYNIPMLPERAQAAWQALTAAQKAAQQATPVEQALIAALAKRYAGPEYVDPVAMQPFNAAYAEAMRDVAARFVDDLDVQVLYAEALMNVNPWKLWAPSGEPAPGTTTIVETLEQVLAKAPTHAGANHYYIHAVEASNAPDKAVPSAERLAALVPGAGHLVHMPAHIFQRVGRYADASSANRQAIEADAAYLRRIKPPGYYPFYTAHNYGFLAYSASMQGRKEEALAAARLSAETMPRDVVCGMPGMDFFLSEPLFVMVRFGMWSELLSEPAPDEKYQVLTALHQHARGMALAATGKIEDAREALQRVRTIQASVPDELTAGLNASKQVFELAAKVVEARVAEAAHEANAVSLWQEAVLLEDALAYNEPADWFYPTRHYLGALLLESGRAKDAEAVYRADLERHPHNGWGLFGVHASLQAQKKAGAAKIAGKQFEMAWKDADVKLERSAF
jgi:tetratricopeptide (TPR) repeat protein